MLRTFFILLFILEIGNVVHSFDCYSCNSDIIPGCHDPFDQSSMNEHLETDLGENAICIKKKVMNNGGIGISRGSTLSHSECPGGLNGCKSYNGEGGTVVKCCCTTSLCNGVMPVKSQPVFFIITTILSVLIFRSI